MKKKLASKVLAGALASVMVLGMAACGNDDNNPSGSTPSGGGSSTPSGGGSTPSNTQAPANTSAPVATPKPDPMKITVSVPALNGNEHLEQNDLYDRLVKEINEYTNMDIQWEWLDSGSYYDVLGEKIKAGNVADVIIGPATADDPVALGAAQEGLFWDMAPYIDEFDNFAAIPEATMRACSVNGAIYFLPRCRDLGRNGWGYRADWAEKLGLKFSEPVMTWQEFHDMLYAFTYNDPDGNGMNDTQGLVLDQWTGAFDIMFSWFNVPTNWGLDEKGDLIHYTQTKEYKTALKAIRELYEEGLINDGSVEGIPAFTEITGGQVRDPYMKTGKAGVMIQVLDDVRKADNAGNGLKDQGFSTDEKPAIQLESAVDTGLGIHTRPNKTGFNGTIMISTVNIKTEDQLKRVMGFLNDINDGEMIKTMDYGWMDLTWNLDENGYVHYFTQEELDASGAKGTKYRESFNQIRTMITAPENAPDVTTAPASTVITAREAYLKDWSINYCVPDMGSGYVSATYTTAEIRKDMDDCINDAQLKYITGEIEENGLDEALSRWMTIGGEQATKEMNELYHAAGN